MLTTLTLAAISVATALTFSLRLVKMRTILKWHWLVDVVFTALMFTIFAGTLGGALVATVAGLILSVTLSIARGTAKVASSLKQAR